MGTLKDQGLIDEEVATFWLNDKSVGTSHVTFGGVIKDSQTGPTYDLKLDKLNDSWWTSDLNGSTYGDYDFNDTPKAILDTGTSFLTISTSDFGRFSNEVLKIAGTYCDTYCVADVPCSTITPSLKDFSF